MRALLSPTAARALSATLSTPVLTAVAFDGADTYSFDLAGSDFTLASGWLRVADFTSGEFSEAPLRPVAMSFDPDAIARLTLAPGSPPSLELVIPLDATGTEVYGVPTGVLRFSEADVAMTATVPEPSTALLVLLGLAVLAARRTRPL